MKIKYLFCLILSLIIISASVLSASAFDYKENDVIIDFIPGDIDGNGSVNALDARLCLRAAAQLETLTDTQKKAADLDGTGEITSITARNILRAGAKIDTLKFTVKIDDGQRIVFTKLVRAGAYDWEHKTDSEKTEITYSNEQEYSENFDGFVYRRYIAIDTTETTAFNVEFRQACPWTDEINYSFDLIIK